MTHDPIRDLLSSVTPSPFIWTPAGHVAILRARVMDAGGDADAVRRWVEEHGGYADRTIPVAPRPGTSYGPTRRGDEFYAVPQAALD